MASHSVHHSSEDYNLTIAMRLSIVEGLFEWMFLIPMVLIGFSPFQAIVSLILVAQFQTWIHTERIKKLDGWMRCLIRHRYIECIMVLMTSI
ncbi:sterol desaturase family protein [Aquimarina hainanensis]|uniref:sterol desaturase family protein n=1 Tax=Aquimarina hainanensis TaxID=1578017 RepID=UPI003618D550